LSILDDTALGLPEPLISRVNSSSKSLLVCNFVQQQCQLNAFFAAECGKKGILMFPGYFANLSQDFCAAAG
jgi:hypothetical protein